MIHRDTKEKGVTYEVAQQIGEMYSDNQDAVLEDCLESIHKWNSYPIDVDGYDEFELPENFPTLSILQ